MPVRPPLFVTLTGADEATDIARMADLSARYPVEWGLLFAPVHQGAGRFPSFDFVAKLIERGAMRFSAHLCGGHAREVVARGVGGPARGKLRSRPDQHVRTRRAARPCASLRRCDGHARRDPAMSRRFPGRRAGRLAVRQVGRTRRCAAVVAEGARRRLLRLRRRPQPGQYRGRSAGDRGLCSGGAALLDRHGKRGADGRPLRSRQVRAGADASVDAR